jgi:DivIVA domain-containing protein
MATDRPNIGVPRVPMTARDVVRTDFGAARRGYDQDEVIAHLGRVADHVAELESKVGDLEVRLRERERAVAPDEAARTEAYQTTAARIADLVRTFDQDIERMRADAQGEAEQRVAEAHANAERVDEEARKLRAEAETEAARIVRDARAEAHQISAEAERSAQETLAALEERRSALVENIRRIREGLGRTAESVDAVLRVADEVRVVVDEPVRPPMAPPMTGSAP